MWKISPAKIFFESLVFINTQIKKQKFIRILWKQNLLLIIFPFNLLLEPNNFHKMQNSFCAHVIDYWSNWERVIGNCQCKCYQDIKYHKHLARIRSRMPVLHDILPKAWSEVCDSTVVFLPHYQKWVTPVQHWQMDCHRITEWLGWQGL